MKLATIGAVLYPLLRFLDYAVPIKPRRVEVRRSLKPGGFLVSKEFILFEGTKSPWAVSRRCTHLGCLVNYRQKENLLLCPCHQSRFTTTGKLINGPAQRDLATFRVERLGDNGAGGGTGYVVSILKV